MAGTIASVSQKCRLSLLGLGLLLMAGTDSSLTGKSLKVS